MELRKHLNPKTIFIGLYVVAFLGYVIYGLQPAEAAYSYEIVEELQIPSIALDSDVTELQLASDGLKTPDTIVGSYSRNANKTLLIGHSTTVFQDLEYVDLEDTVVYGGQEYRVVAIDMVAKNKINMDKLLQSSEKNTLIIMTCAGKLLDGGDATHRLILTAISRV